MTPPSFLKSFSRAQLSSSAATVVDFGLLFFLTEICNVWYVLATASGALAGAITNFSINRYWSFSATHRDWKRQALKYALVSAISLILNAGGAYVVTEFGGLHYSISVVLVSLVVGFGFNYPAHRSFVFRH